MRKNNIKPDSELIVEKPCDLLEYLLLKIENKSKNNIKSLLSRGNISVDGKVTTKYNYRLNIGQKVTIKWFQIYDKNYKEVLDILYEDNEIIVINKPAKLLTISDDNNQYNTAYSMVMNYVKRNNRGNKIFIVHRLDRDTSGVLLIAKNENIKYLLQDNWNNLLMNRGYIAVVEGKIEKDSETIKSWLKETSTKLVYSSNVKGDGKEAITHYHSIKSNNKYTLLEISITTGRKNQIRVHMKDIGHPVVGDKKYGSTSNPIKRLGLHAHILEFKHPITKKVMRFETSVPNEFESLFGLR